MDDTAPGPAAAADGAAGPAVGLLVDSGQADDRRLIRLVRDRPLLYARNNMPVASYYPRVRTLWREVAQTMGWSVPDVRRKWSHIRNSYSRHLRNEMHGARTGKGRRVSRWYLADELNFLRQHMATDTRPLGFASMLDSEPAESVTAEVDFKPLLQSPWFPMTATPPVHGSPSLHDDSSGSAFEHEDNSSYFQFFKGIHNDYLELSSKNQRSFKRRCLHLLHEMLDEEEATRRYPSDAVNLSGHVSDEEREHKFCVVEKVAYVLPDQTPASPPNPH